MPEVMDWDAAYRNEVFGGPPPWNIGEPQPAIAELIRLGKLRSEMLDAGCGVGDTSIELAAQGRDSGRRGTWLDQRYVRPGRYHRRP
jgi:2-polyprenyl-3-methyl-5-hydroxy-6-metoxy-1,4-benzoquinol methylase